MESIKIIEEEEEEKANIISPMSKSMNDTTPHPIDSVSYPSPSINLEGSVLDELVRKIRYEVHQDIQTSSFHLTRQIAEQQEETLQMFLLLQVLCVFFVFFFIYITLACILRY